MVLKGESHLPPKTSFSCRDGAAARGRGKVGTVGTVVHASPQAGARDGAAAGAGAATAIYPTLCCQGQGTLTFSSQGGDDGQGQQGLQGRHSQQCAARGV